MTGDWIARNWWQVLSALILLIGYIVVVANAVKSNRELIKDVEDLKNNFQAHLNAQGLHRSPDFELRMLNIERQLENASTLLRNIQDGIRSLMNNK